MRFHKVTEFEYLDSDMFKNIEDQESFDQSILEPLKQHFGKIDDIRIASSDEDLFDDYWYNVLSYGENVTELFEDCLLFTLDELKIATLSSESGARFIILNKNFVEEFKNII